MTYFPRTCLLLGAPQSLYDFHQALRLVTRSTAANKEGNPTGALGAGSENQRTMILLSSHMVPPKNMVQCNRCVVYSTGKEYWVLHVHKNGAGGRDDSVVLQC